eukprot:CAMPEP_0119119896 /NCGR_PEP_ID=MMETSP1310-20130426/1188_1 /TAXON_ID=464262 /ORGANISM="Genus nov. species nov., Strain RCC2339" /LENGTH=386 /DNA_ID=CAMNT_0007109355 /DNA_START=77 /DNA_END=1237 /DNA_ORIENTATION=-
MAWPISEQGIRNLRLYKYSGDDQSLVVKYVLRDFWNWLLTFFPLWLAPNLITAVGFSCVMAGYFAFVTSVPNFTEDGPTWLYFFLPVMIFTYQILDNLDGRQARRTGTSSPLGELFDHACDSLYATFSLATTIHIFGLDIFQSFVAYYLMAVIPFYVSHWEEYYAGVLVLGKFVNPTEAQLLQCVGFLFVGILGRSACSEDVELPFGYGVWPRGTLFVFCSYFLVAYFVFSSMLVVFRNIREKTGTKHDWHNMSPGQSLLLFMPIIYLFVTLVAWFKLSPTQVLENHPHLCFALSGLLFSSMLNRMMVDRMTKIPTVLFPWQPLVPLLGAIPAYYGHPDEDILYALLVAMSLFYLYFAVAIINQLCDALKIRCFRIPYKTYLKPKK